MPTNATFRLRKVSTKPPPSHEHRSISPRHAAHRAFFHNPTWGFVQSSNLTPADQYPQCFDDLKLWVNHRTCQNVLVLGHNLHKSAVKAHATVGPSPKETPSLLAPISKSGCLSDWVTPTHLAPEAQMLPDLCQDPAKEHKNPTLCVWEGKEQFTLRTQGDE